MSAADGSDYDVTVTGKIPFYSATNPVTGAEFNGNLYAIKLPLQSR